MRPGASVKNANYFENTEKSIEIAGKFCYYIKAFRTGADFFSCGYGLGGGVKLPEEKTKIRRKIKCQ